jgi:hypothetical protein
MSWNDPTSDDIKAAATALSQQLVPSLTSFAFDPYKVFTTYVRGRVHFGTWSVGDRTLFVGVNLDRRAWSIPLTKLPRWKENARLIVLYGLGTRVEWGHLMLEGLGATGFVVDVTNGFTGLDGVVE